MADEKPTSFATLGSGALQFADWVTAVDTSDTTDDATGSDVKLSPLVVTRRLSTQHSISSTTGTQVSDLDCILPAGTFVFRYALVVRSATSTVGPMLGVNFSGTGQVRAIFWFADATSAITAETHTMDDQGSTAIGYISGMANSATSTTSPNMGTTVGVASTATDIPCFIDGIVIVTVTGTLALWHSSETATATSVEVGSSLIVTRTA